MRKKNTETIDNGVRVVHSCGNVFIDLGFDEAEAHVMLMKAHLMIQLEKHIEAKNWTRAEAAKHIGITQPRVSKLLKRNWDEFSLEMLIMMATKLGIRSELKLAA
jgi:predicted XRE-type DNA-binding protein